MIELIVDNFAGGGGASVGIEMALGRPVDIAVNHDAAALAMHKANHPRTLHLLEDVFEVDPVKVAMGRPVGLCWFSPDCKHFSKAKGGKPVSKRIRGLAWVAVRWAATVKPRVIILENVEEFTTWGPLGPDNRPCPKRRGKTFKAFIRRLEGEGYRVEWRELRACDYGAPTIRKRLFLVARCDGQPIVWPAPTHGDPADPRVQRGRLLPWRTAAECIDWSIPCPSIFERKRPLAEATCRRIARGVMKYVVEAADPFIVKFRFNNDGASIRKPLPTITAGSYKKRPGGAGHALGLCVPTLVTNTTGHAPQDVRKPFPTIATGGHQMLAGATLVQTGYGERRGQTPRVPGLKKPLGTAVGGQKHALVAAWLAKHNGGVVGQIPDQPIGTVTSKDHHSLVTAFLSHQYSSNTCGGQGSPNQPMKTVTASGQHHALVKAFLTKFYGQGTGSSLKDPAPTTTQCNHVGLVTVEGTEYIITDIGLRMLQPPELFAAQGFPSWYRIKPEVRGKPMTKTDQVRMVGNSVCPPLAAAIVRSNCAGMVVERGSQVRMFGKGVK